MKHARHVTTRFADESDLAIDRIERLSDLVNEVYDDAESGIRFWLRGRLPDGEDPHGEGFAWSIMSALAHSVTIDKDAGDHVVSVTRRRGPVLDSAH